MTELNQIANRHQSRASEKLLFFSSQSPERFTMSNWAEPVVSVPHPFRRYGRPLRQLRTAGHLQYSLLINQFGLLVSRISEQGSWDHSICWFWPQLRCAGCVGTRCSPICLRLAAQLLSPWYLRVRDFLRKRCGMRKLACSSATHCWLA